MTREDMHQLVTDLFEEEALSLGGLVAVHDVEDETVWRFVRMLDGVRERFMARVDAWGDEPLRGHPEPEEVARPHPAVEEFLRRLGRN